MLYYYVQNLSLLQYYGMNFFKSTFLLKKSTLTWHTIRKSQNVFQSIARARNIEHRKKYYSSFINCRIYNQFHSEKWSFQYNNSSEATYSIHFYGKMYDIFYVILRKSIEMCNFTLRIPYIHYCSSFFLPPPSYFPQKPRAV